MSPLDQLTTFLKFPSISTDPHYAGDVESCARWLESKLISMGLTAKVHRTAGHPIVTARNAHVAGRTTVLVYGHYDVQPVDPVELWESPPFEPVIHDGRIWARGSSDDKGPLLTHVLGVEALLKADGDLPVNLIFLFEGEEEIGSPSLVPFLKAHAEELACDIIIASDTGMVSEKHPTLSYGLRGITACEVIVRGPLMDLHSGLFGGAVANPATALCEIVASLHDEEGRVAIDGFYTDVRPLELWERKAWSMVPGYTDADMKKLTGSPAVYGESGFTTAERLWARPTAEVNGLTAAYQGPGSKTVIGTHAVAKLSFRLVPDQDPADIMKKIRRHIERHTPIGVTVEIVEGHSGVPYMTDPHSRYGKAAQDAIESVFSTKATLIREGGSIPIISAFKQYLGADSLLIGLALPDCRMHSPNENFSLYNFDMGIRLSQALLRRLGEIRA